ncbi:MAG: hypothetical protein ACXW3M_15290 [Rhodoplanes sp.]
MSTKDLPHVDLPPDPVIEDYKKDSDRTARRENLKLTPAQRLERMCDFAEAMRLTRGTARRQ